MHVSGIVREMIALAKKTGVSVVKANFQGVELTVDSDSNVEDIVSFYDKEMDRLCEESRKSPEGQRLVREKEKSLVEAQRKHNALMQQLDRLDFSNDVAVLDWVYEFYEVYCHCGRSIVMRLQVVIATFTAHGFQPDVNNGDDFDENDRSNYARWIIGQMLDILEHRRSMPDWAIPIAVERWRKRFLATS